MSRRRAVSAVGIGATIAAAVIALPAAAFASPMPPKPMPKTEAFTISINGLTNAATGNATGPVHGAFTDVEGTATNGVWTFPYGKVDVKHTAVTAQPTGFTPANACTASVTATGNWWMNGLTGVDRHAKGSGTFSATITETVKENTTYQVEKVVKYIKVRVHRYDRHGHDMYGKGHERFKIIEIVRYVKVPVQTCDTNPADQPVSVSVAVTGTGTATNIYYPPIHHGKI